MKKNIASFALLLIAGLLSVTCGGGRDGTTKPTLPPPDGTKPVVVAPVPGQPVFHFADQFDRLFVRLSGDGWQPATEGLGAPVLEYSSDVVAISRSTTAQTPHTGVSFDVYRGEHKACSFTVGPLAIVSRAYPHFGQRDDLGVAPDQEKKQIPKFDELLAQASHHLGAVVGDCGTPTPKADRELVWARPSAAAAPAIWRRLPEGDRTAAELGEKVTPLATGLAFGKQAADYARENPNEQLTANQAVFAGPGVGEYLVEDFRQIGETTCGGNGHEQWSLWLVKDGTPRLLVSEENRKKLALVADLDLDGAPEFIAGVDYYGNERAVFRVKDGRLEVILEDKYPFNDCGC